MEVGEIIKTVPSQNEIEEGNFGYEFTVVLRTDKPETAINEALSSIADIDDVSIRGLEIEHVDMDKDHSSGSKSIVDDRTRDTKPGTGRSMSTSMKSLRINADKLDKMANLVGELVINKSRLAQISSEYRMEELRNVMATVERTINDLQYEVTQMRMIPVGHVFNRFPKLVRDLYRSLGKDIEFVVEGKEIELDKTVLEEIVDPLVHLLRNAVDHGIEYPAEREERGKSRRGTIRLTAKRDTAHVVISVEDDGRGMDAGELKAQAVARGMMTAEEADRLSEEEALNLIFMPGFSTAREVTEISGRGVGMEVVKARVEALNGSVELKTKKGEGTRISLKLPLTTAIIRALLVDVCGMRFAIPLANVSEIVGITPAEMKTVIGREVILLRGSVLPLFMLHSLLGERADTEQEHKRLAVVVVDADANGACSAGGGGAEGEGRIGIVVDSVVGQQEIVVKPPGERLQSAKGLGGFTITGDGAVIPILDIPSIPDISTFCIMMREGGGGYESWH